MLPAAKPDDLNLLTGTHMFEGETQASPKSCNLSSTFAPWQAFVHVYMRTISKQINTYMIKAIK